jgi:Gas vesicle protein
VATPLPRKETVAEHVLDAPEASVLDVLDHVLSKGVMASGDVMLGVAGIDLIYVRLSALLCAADRVLPSADRAARRRHRKPRLFPKAPR